MLILEMLILDVFVSWNFFVENIEPKILVRLEVIWYIEGIKPI